MIKVKRQVTAWIVEASQTAHVLALGLSLPPSLSLRHWRVSVCETARAGVFKQRGNAWKNSPPITHSICPAAAHCPHPSPAADHGRLKLGAVEVPLEQCSSAMAYLHEFQCLLKKEHVKTVGFKGSKKMCKCIESRASIGFCKFIVRAGNSSAHPLHKYTPSFLLGPTGKIERLFMLFCNCSSTKHLD